MNTRTAVAKAKAREQMGEFEALSVFAMSNALLRKLMAMRATAWRDYHFYMTQNSAGLVQAAHALRRWLAADTARIVALRLTHLTRPFATEDDTDLHAIALQDLD